MNFFLSPTKSLKRSGMGSSITYELSSYPSSSEPTTKPKTSASFSLASPSKPGKMSKPSWSIPVPPMAQLRLHLSIQSKSNTSHQKSSPLADHSIAVSQLPQVRSSSSPAHTATRSSLTGWSSLQNPLRIHPSPSAMASSAVVTQIITQKANSSGNTSPNIPSSNRHSPIPTMPMQPSGGNYGSSTPTARN